MPGGDLLFNDLLFSLLVKGTLKIYSKADLKIGIGWSIIKHLNAYSGSIHFPAEFFSIGQAFQSKVELGIQITHEFSLQPSLSYRLNLKEEYPTLAIKIGNARAFHFTLGLAVGL